MRERLPSPLPWEGLGVSFAPLLREGLGEEAKCSAYAPVVLANAYLGDKTFGNASPHLGKASRQSAGVFFRLVGRHDNWREACTGIANAKPKAVMRIRDEAFETISPGGAKDLRQG